MTNWFVKCDSVIRQRLHLLYLTIAVPMIVALIFITPPLAVPDEGAHFLRAVQVSKGQLIAEFDTPQLPGGWLPADVVAFATSNLFQRNFNVTYIHGVDQHFLDETERERAKVRSLAWAGQPVFISYPATARYPATSYAVSALSLFVCRMFGLSLLHSFYWGRLTNGVCSLLIGTFALRYCTQMRFFLLCVLTLPMTLSLQGSFSQDSILINVSTAIAVLVLCTNPLQASVKWGAIAFLMSCLVGAKAFYAPLYLITCLAISKPVYRHLSVLVILSFLVVILDNLEGLKVPVIRGLEADPNQQLAHLEKQPYIFLNALINTLMNKDMPEGIIGILGYLEVRLPACVYIFYGLAFIAALARDVVDLELTRAKYTLILFFLGLSMILACSLWAFALEYVEWSPLDGAKIYGLHLLPQK